MDQLHMPAPCAAACDAPSDPAATIAAYLLAWPEVREQIEARLAAQATDRSPAEIAADRDDLIDLERCLNRVAVLAARLADHQRVQC